MFRVLALAKDKKLYEEIESIIDEARYVRISTFTNSLDLLEIFSSLHTELVILDLDLLNEEVIKLINILRSIKKNSQIMLVLSQDKMPICSAAFSLGVVSYLIKPFSVKNASEIIASALHLSAINRNASGNSADDS